MAFRNPFRSNTSSDTGPISPERRALDRSDREAAAWAAGRPARAARHRKASARILNDAEDFRIGWGRRR